MLLDNKPLNFHAAYRPEGFAVRHRGCAFNVKVRTPEAGRLAAHMPIKVAPDTSNLLLCPMPGVVVKVMAEVGDIVEDGQALAVVEAMKMENTLRAEKRARVSAIKAAAGENLAVDAVIMEFEAV